MSVDSNYNSQFIQLDFQLLDNPEFVTFVSKAEFATYLILRRFIWRSGEHRLGLHKLYAEQHLLASSVGAKRIASMLGLKDITRVSKHLKSLEDEGVIRRRRTGRETISVMGEWHKPEGFTTSKEFYFLENRFGVTDLPNKGGFNNTERKTELAPDPKSELPDVQVGLGSNSPIGEKPQAVIEKTGDKVLNTVTVNSDNAPSGNGGQSPVMKLPRHDLPPEQTEHIANEILKQFGDQQSLPYYRHIAARVPYEVIKEAMSNINAFGADSPPRVFTTKMNKYAQERLTHKHQQALQQMRKEMLPNTP